MSLNAGSAGGIIKISKIALQTWTSRNNQAVHKVWRKITKYSRRMNNHSCIWATSAYPCLIIKRLAQSTADGTVTHILNILIWAFSASVSIDLPAVVDDSQVAGEGAAIEIERSGDAGSASWLIHRLASVHRWRAVCGSAVKSQGLLSDAR